jgi:hypothetical protein
MNNLLLLLLCLLHRPSHREREPEEEDDENEKCNPFPRCDSGADETGVDDLGGSGLFDLWLGFGVRVAVGGAVW